MSGAPDEVDPLSKAMGSAVEQLIESGFQLPMHAAVVGVNGTAFVLRWTPLVDGSGLQAHVLAEHNEPNGMMATPINIMISDARGEAARVVIHADGSHRMIH